MDNNMEAFEALKEYIVNNFDGKVASGGKEIVKKCHICGDSMDPKSRHMYIGLHPKTGLLVYNCFKCDSGGMVDAKFLKQMEYSMDPNLINKVSNYNKTILSLPQNRIIRTIENSIIKSPNFYFNPTETNQYKIAKISNRMGFEFTEDLLMKFKIVPDLKGFLSSNGINMISRAPQVVDYINEYFIGFLSIDNSFIIFRNLLAPGKLPEFIDKRYINYNIFNKIGNSNRHYVIPSRIDTTDPRRIKIYIAEGVFDIISVYQNLVQDKDQSIFCSIGGKSYLMMIKFFFENYGLINVEFHICPDADIPEYEMKNIATYLKPFGTPLYIHRNLYPGEKDFGVSPDRIEEGIIQYL